MAAGQMAAGQMAAGQRAGGAQAAANGSERESQVPGLSPGRLQALLAAVAVEAAPLLAQPRSARLTIHFSGGAKVRLEVVHFADVALAE